MGTFLTQWGYIKEGLLSPMQYPDGEMLTYSYVPQGMLNTVLTDQGTTSTGDDLCAVEAPPSPK